VKKKRYGKLGVCDPKERKVHKAAWVAGTAMIAIKPMVMIHHNHALKRPKAIEVRKSTAKNCDNHVEYLPSYVLPFLSAMSTPLIHL